MNLRQLRYFVKIVELGNMTRAAESLFVAQPALGMQIRQLEEDLGVALLVRHSRGVEPTAAGMLLHDRAREILELVEQTRRDVAAQDGEGTEAIRLGLTPMLMLVVGPDIVVNVRDRVPHVILRVVEDMSHVLVDHLSRGEIDFALAYDVPETPQVTLTPLLREDLVLVTLPSPRKSTSVTAAEALRETLALPESGDTIRELVVRAARELGLEAKIAFEVRSISGIKNLILRGAASGVLPYGSVLDEVRTGKLQALPIASPPLQRTLSLAAFNRRTPFRNEPALRREIRSSLTVLTDKLGPLARPVPPDDMPA
ncbi:MAG: LysR family transcriptional regulator [Burkholderiales bacterium]